MYVIADSEAFLWKVTDAIGFLKCNIAEAIQSWNTKLNDFVQLRKKEEKQTKVRAIFIRRMCIIFIKIY